MARPEKVQAVADIKERLEGARAVFLAEYAGLSVKEQQELRRSLRAGGAEFKIVKMTLARRAAAELDIDTLDELLLGPTGLTFADSDPVEAAKALKDFAASHEALKVKGGLLAGDFLTPERVSELADIEPREVLLAKLAGGFQAPMARFAGLLAALPRNLANAMLQLVEKKEQEGPAEPEPEAAAEPDTTEETPAAAAEPEAEQAPEQAAEATAEPEDAAAEPVAEADAPAEAEEAPAAETASTEEPADEPEPEDSAPEATTEDEPAAAAADDAPAAEDADDTGEAGADEATEDTADDEAGESAEEDD